MHGSSDVYMILKYVESRNDTIVVDYACVWLIIYQGCPILFAYLIIILKYYFTLGVKCMMKIFFLSWIDYPKIYIIVSFTELCSLCSFSKFSNEDLVEPYTEQVLEDRQQGM